MPIAPVFDLPIPAPHNALFTDGERALSVATPIGSSVGRAQFYLARWMNFLGGTYTIKVLADDAAVWFAGASADGLRPLHGSTHGQGVQSAQVYIPEGLQRLDIVLQNMTVGAASCYVAFSLWQGGRLVYASTGTSWQFDTAPISDASLLGVQDQRRLLPVFTVLPNWKDGILERISYHTDTMTSETGNEQHRSLTVHPRRSFEAAFLRHGSHRARLDNFFVGVGSKKILFPLWHEQFHVPVAMPLGSTGVTLPAETLSKREFREGDLVIAINRDPDDYEILEVLTVNTTTDRVTWVVPTAKNWPLGTAVIPLRQGRVSSQTTLNNLSDRVVTVRARFDVAEAEEGVLPSWGYCAPLFRFAINWADQVTATPNRLDYVIDSGLGVADVYDPGERSVITTRMSVRLKGRERVHAMRAFIAMARGGAVRFYMPSQVLSIEPLGDISGLTFDAKPAGFVEYMQRPQSARVLFGVVFSDGRPTVYRTIIGVEEVLSVTAPFRPVAERFTLDRFLPPIDKVSIERVMFIMPVRFGQDTFELKHHVNESALVTTTLVTRSTDITDMPPIDCVVTSRPYPIEVVEELRAAAGSLSGWDYDPRFFEFVDVGLTGIVDGSFSGGVETTEMLDEAIEVGLTGVVDGAFSGGVVSTEMLDEAIDVGASVADGTLVVILLSYTALDEAVDVSANIVDGTLV